MKLITKFKRNRLIYILLLPSLFLVGLIFLWPSFDIIRLSFYEADITSGVQDFVGFDNFRSIFDRAFLIVLLRTFYFVVGSTIPALAIGLGLALVLSKEFPGNKICWVLIFLPWAIPGAVTSIMWRWFLHQIFGFMNHLLLTLGVIENAIPFLGIDWAFTSVVFVRIWKSIPFAMISYVAAIKGIPDALYEAADVDGATIWQKFRFITIPSLKYITVMSSIIMAVWAFVTFDLVWVLTEGGPMGATTILPVLIYRAGFVQYRVGIASAMSFVGIIILLFMCYFYYKFTLKEE